MQHSSLMSFLNGFTPPEHLFSEIADELAACLAAMAKGGSGHVIITDGPDVVISRKQVGRLVEALAAGRLPLNAASYIADALTMSDDFDFANEVVAEAVLFLSDDGRPLTLDDVQGLRHRLASTA